MLELAREVALEVRGPDTARALLPPGRGRGSSVSSIVCYLTGLSHVDPIANDLFLGRFLNEELTALPDIDLDFPRDVRAALIPRIHERYGKDRSALVAAFPTYRARGAIRELGKALGLPPGEIERVARGSEGWSARDVAHDVAAALGAAAARADGRWAWLARLAEQAHGLPRHLSQHPGGMVVATRPLIDCCPIVPAAMEGRQMVQWDKDSCADAGFLKIDLLGLGMLSAVERAVEDIARHRDERIDLSRIPYDDPPTYDAIQRAETIGVFQIESRAQMASLLRTRPRTLQDITIQVAIVRPGPIQGGAVNPYIERLQRLRVDPDYEIPYEHPSLVEPLRETLGTIIFQDQVIEVAMAFAGFSAGEAEGLRRAMSRKRSEAAIEAHHAKFVEGAIATHGVERELAERVFDKVRGFSGFGFPKAHGAAFGLLAYQSTWLRVHYAAGVPLRAAERAADGLLPARRARARGAAARAHDPAAGRERERGRLHDRGGRRRRAGRHRPHRPRLRARRPAGRRGGARRRARGRRPFRDLGDLAARAGAGRPALELLAWSGACDGLAGGDRRVALWRLGVATPGEARRRRGRSSRSGSISPPRRRSSAWALGRAARRLRHDRPHRPLAPARAAAPDAAARHRREPRPAADRARRARARGGDGRRAPAPGHRERRRLHAAGGRARDDQPDRPAEALRAQPPDRPHRAARARRRAARAPCRRRAAGSTCSSSGSSRSPAPERAPARCASSRRQAWTSAAEQAPWTTSAPSRRPS